MRHPSIGRRAFVVGLGCIGCRAVTGRDAAVDPTGGGLRVLTLNLAHGRGRSIFQSNIRAKRWYLRNLEVIAGVLRREAADVVALQEAELGSRWAGDFDHVAHLAGLAEYPHLAATPHVRGEHASYGTAILSRLPVLERGGRNFEAQGRWNKGFTRVRVRSTTDQAIRDLEVVSVHLDFARGSTRRLQIAELVAEVDDHSPPFVVAGDFNTDDSETLSPLRTSLDLHTRRGALTHPFSGRRFDWVFASSSLRFVRHRVLVDDRLSDHRAVVADLGWS